MPLSEASVAIRESVGGQLMLMFRRTDSKMAQGVAIVDTNGNHVGGEDNGLHVVAIDFEHYEIHEGDAYTLEEVITLGSGATQNYILTVPDTTKWPHFGYECEGSFGVTVEMFRGSDRTPTTLQTAINRNHNSLNTAGMTIHKGYSGGTTDGTKVLWSKSGTGTSGGKVAERSSESTERILKQDTQYTFRITSAAASNDIAISFSWYEHTFAETE